MIACVSGPAAGELLPCFEALALEAGRAIMEVRAGGASARLKPDASPVTEADLRAEAIILKGLRHAFAAVPCVAEEESAAGIAPRETGSAFFLIDPLDGTREFVAGSADFTVNIALIENGLPVAGVVYAPARNLLYSGGPAGAEEIRTGPDHAALGRRAIRVRPRYAPPVVVASRSHRTPQTDRYIAAIEGATCVAIGSSLKFCILAAGEADLYPRFGPTMQWDTAAGDAVLRAAGGATSRLDGTPLPYGAGAGDPAGGFLNPFFIAEGGPRSDPS